MKSVKNRKYPVLAFLVLGFFSLHAYAGRPLLVDDAGVNDKGHGHVEAWYARGAEKNNSWHIAPAYSPTDWLEITAAFSRDNSEKFNSKGLTAKILFSPSKESGCNPGVLAGFSQTNGHSHTDTHVTGLLTCNTVTYGSVHFNLGISALADTSPVHMGIAYEKPIGPVTANLEIFKERYSKPITQIGLRGYILPRIQLDGSIGRQGSDTIFSIGTKIEF